MTVSMTRGPFTSLETMKTGNHSGDGARGRGARMRDECLDNHSINCAVREHGAQQVPRDSALTYATQVTEPTAAPPEGAASGLVRRLLMAGVGREPTHKKGMADHLTHTRKLERSVAREAAGDIGAPSNDGDGSVIQRAPVAISISMIVNTFTGGSCMHTQRTESVSLLGEALLRRRLVLSLAAACVIGAGATAHAELPSIIELTLPQIQADYAAGKYTAVELTQAMLDHITQYEPTYNAWITLDPQGALAQAAQIDAMMSSPGPKSPLFGVPIAIKDPMDVAGLPTTVGSTAFSSRTGGVDIIPELDAPLVERLRAAGAIILGKTNVPDFSRTGTHSTSSLEGATHNAYVWDRVPGGSSGGSGVAVATSMAVVGMA